MLGNLAYTVLAITLLGGGVYVKRDQVVATTYAWYEVAADNVRYWSSYDYNSCPHKR
jgi:hypothetical protein